MNQVLIEMAGNAAWAGELGLAAALPTDVCLVDTTCLEANIHFPGDWVLLRDVAATQLQATTLIRATGMRTRLPCEPVALARQMNRLCL